MKAISNCPIDAQVKVYKVLHHAISLNSAKEAQAYLESHADELGAYGFLMQLAVKHLLGKNGWSTANDILDRLFGKARQTTDLNVDAPVDVNITVGSAEAAEGLKKAIESGAKPKE